MDYQFNKEIGQVFENADFTSDDFENYGFEELNKGHFNELLIYRCTSPFSYSQAQEAQNTGLGKQGPVN